MKLGSIVLHLRNSDTSFENRIGGAAEYAFAEENTLKKEYAFVFQTQDSAEVNTYDSGIIQPLTEQFAVVVAIKNDTNHKDKTGFISYNRLHDVRQEMFKAFLGLDAYDILYDENEQDMFSAESLIYYRGGRLINFDRSYLWYQFTFEYKVILESKQTQPDLPWFNRIYAQYELMPSHNIPISEALPVDSFEAEMEQMIDFSLLGAARGWILENGYWDDLGQWEDMEEWID